MNHVEEIIINLPLPEGADKVSQALVASMLEDVEIPLADCIRLREACLVATDPVLIVETAALVALHGDVCEPACLEEAEGILDHVLSLPETYPVYVARRVDWIRGKIERLRDLA